MPKHEIDKALDRLQDIARDADHHAKDTVSIKTADLIHALNELDRMGVINLDMD